MSTERLWTKNYVANIATNFFIFFGYYLIMVILALHAMHRFHATPSQAGLAAGIFIVGGLFARIVSGAVIESVGRKRLLIAGLVVFSCATALYWFIGSMTQLYFVRILHGIGWGMATTSTATIVAYLIPSTRRGEGMGYYSMSVTLASAIAPLIGINLYHYSGFESILYMCAALLVLAFVAVGILKIKTADTASPKGNMEVIVASDDAAGSVMDTVELEQVKTADASRLRTRLRPDHLFEKSVLPLASIGLLTFFGYSSIIGFLSSYAQAIDLSGAGSLFFLFYSGAILISRPFSGKLFDARGENSTMYPSFLLFAAGLFLISQAHTGVMLLFSGVLMGLGFGTFSGSAQTIAIKIAPAHRIGLATSTFLAISELGIGLGPYVLGLIQPLTGYRGLYVVMGCVVLGAMVLYFFLHGRQAPYPHPKEE